MIDMDHHELNKSAVKLLKHLVLLSDIHYLLTLRLPLSNLIVTIKDSFNLNLMSVDRLTFKCEMIGATAYVLITLILVSSTGHNLTHILSIDCFVVNIPR